MRLKVEDMSPQEGAYNGLLEWRGDVGVDSCVHESVLNSIEVIGKDIIVPCDAHIARNGGW